MYSKKIKYQFFDRYFLDSTGIYSRHKHKDNFELDIINNNRQNVARSFNCSDIVTLQQVHSADIYYVDKLSTEEVRADALITDKVNIPIAIMTADCLPVLFSSTDNSVIAAVHAGWRGMKAGILESTITEMQKLTSSPIRAYIGPAIAQKSYEVDENFYHNFISDDKSYDQFFCKSRKPGHYLFDLPSCGTFKIEASGGKIEYSASEDTYSAPEKYPSYRRSYHKGENYRGSILSVITIMED